MKTKLNMNSLLILKIYIHVGFTNRSNLAPIKVPITGNIGVLSKKQQADFCLTLGGLMPTIWKLITNGQFKLEAYKHLKHSDFTEMHTNVYTFH
jgi:hypothetical protein